MLEPRALGDPDETLPAESAQGEETIEHVLHAALIEGTLIDQDRSPNFGNLDSLRSERDRWIQEAEEERVEDPEDVYAILVSRKQTTRR